MNGQCARVLEVLSDGRPHSVAEIHRRAGTMRLNSRVSELRLKHGHNIVCRRVRGIPGPEAYEYTLVSSAEPDAKTPVSGSEDLNGSPLLKGPASTGHAGVGPSPLDESQLELAELRTRRAEIAWNIAANSHLDQENARDTLVRTDRAIARSEATL